MSSLGFKKQNNLPKNTIFQNIGINRVNDSSEDSESTPHNDNEEVKLHLEKMSKELKLENEMEVF